MNIFVLLLCWSSFPLHSEKSNKNSHKQSNKLWNNDIDWKYDQDRNVAIEENSSVLLTQKTATKEIKIKKRNIWPTLSRVLVILSSKKLLSAFLYFSLPKIKLAFTDPQNIPICNSFCAPLISLSLPTSFYLLFSVHFPSCPSLYVWRIGGLTYYNKRFQNW